MNELHPHPWLTTYRQYSSCLIEINLIPDCAALHPWFSLTPSLIGLHTISDWATTQSELSYKYIPFLIGLHTISDLATTQSNLSCMYNCTSHSAYYTISDWATTQSKLSYMYIPFLIGLHTCTISDWATTQSKLSCIPSWLSHNPIKIELQPNQKWAAIQSKLS